MKRLIILLFSLCLFASVEGQAIINARPNARAQVSGISYGPELNPNVPCDNTAYWYEFDGFLAQAGGMVCVAGGYAVSNPNSGWSVSGDYHIVITITNYSGAGNGLRVSFCGGYSTYMTANNTYTFDVTEINDEGIYMTAEGCNCTITSLSIKAIL